MSITNTPYTNKKSIHQMANSAKTSNDGLSNLLNVLSSNLGDDTSRQNASTIYNILKYFI